MLPRVSLKSLRARDCVNPFLARGFVAGYKTPRCKISSLVRKVWSLPRTNILSAPPLRSTHFRCWGHLPSPVPWMTGIYARNLGHKTSTAFMSSATIMLLASTQHVLDARSRDPRAQSKNKAQGMRSDALGCGALYLHTET